MATALPIVPAALKGLLEDANYIGSTPSGSKLRLKNRTYVAEGDFWGWAARKFNGEASSHSTAFIRSTCEEMIQAIAAYRHHELYPLLLKRAMTMRSGIVSLSKVYVTQPNVKSHLDDSIEILDVGLPEEIKRTQGISTPLYRGSPDTLPSSSPVTISVTTPEYPALATSICSRSVAAGSCSPVPPPPPSLANSLH